MADDHALTHSQQKWDQRFAEQQALPPVASVLLENRDLLPRQGRGLELACGLGANSLYLAKQGMHMDAWDISPVALDKLAHRARQQRLAVTTHWVDVEAQSMAIKDHYNLIIVSHFLHRPLCTMLSDALRPGGLLFYQTFCAEHTPFASSGSRSNSGSSPRNPRYKLSANELLQLFADLEVLRYREGTTPGEKPTHKAFYVGRKPP